MQRSFGVLALALCLGCVEEASDADPNAVQVEEDAAVEVDAGAEDAQADLPGDPNLPGPPEVGEWSEVLPGGDTICSRGTPYRFYVAGGSAEKIVIDFQGGGACWDEFTCSIAGAIFSEAATPLSTVVGALDAGYIGGLYAAENEEHPLADWSLVHLPYCTGDVHWGNNVKTYKEDLTIHHKGFVNARTVLDWTQRHYPDAKEILVTGCSAGAYGALLHSAYVAQRWPEAKITMLADSGAGIITETFFADSFPNWGAAANLPEWIPGLHAKPVEEMDLTDVYVALAEHYPQFRFAHFTSAFDDNQTFFFTAMGGEAEDWPGLMRARMEDIRARAENFRYYIPPGPVHCILPYHIFYSQAVGGVRFVDWLRELVLGEDIPDDAACEGEACFDDEACAACVEDDGLAWCGFCRGWPDKYRFEE